MHLKFSHSGRQFFFVTIGIEGRTQVLSEIVADEKRPRLSFYGEAVKAGFLALHKVYPAITASDFVIMPDHFHLVMIVNYALAPKLDPLWVCHRLLDAIETAWSLGEGGAAAVERLFRAAVERGRAQAAAYYAEVARGRTGAQPPNPEWHSPRTPGAMPPNPEWRSPRTPEARPMSLGEGFLGYGGTAPVRPLPRFERTPWIDLSFDSRQLKAIRHYIRLNPARFLWKHQHADLFTCHRAIKAARLARFAPLSFDGLGNLPLLGSPFLLHVRLTLKKTVAEHAAAIAEIVEKARRGVVPVSGFISPGEKELLRQLKAEPRARFVRLLPCALPPRYDPSAEDSREIAAGRMAILAFASAGTPASSLEMKQSSAAAHQFRANCLAMNEIAAKLCAGEEDVCGQKALGRP